MRKLLLCITLCVVYTGLAGCGQASAGLGELRRERPAPAPAPVRAFAFEPDVVLLLSGAAHGRLEMCNCGDVMPGGLTRRGGLLASYRAARQRTIAIDMGDLFWIEPDPVREEFLLRGLDMLGYDALALGDLEWCTPPEQLAAAVEGKRPALLCTNVSGDGVAVQGQLVYRQGGWTLVILGYVGEGAFQFSPPDALARLRRQGPDELARRVRQLKQDGYTVVVLAHDTPEGVERLAREAPQIDVLVRGHASGPQWALQRSGPVPTAQVGGPDYVAALAMRRSAGGQVELDWRIEVLDSAWPADQRMQELYQSYIEAAMLAELGEPWR